MIYDTIITKLFNCSWSRRNKNTPATAVDITVYNNREDDELILFELYNRANHITHITLSKRQLLAVLQLNKVIKQNTDTHPTAKSATLPDAKGRPTSGEITCGLNRPR
jgi:hypothetical protein